MPTGTHLPPLVLGVCDHTARPSSETLTAYTPGPPGSPGGEHEMRGSAGPRLKRAAGEACSLGAAGCSAANRAQCTCTSAQAPNAPPLLHDPGAPPQPVRRVEIAAAVGGQRQITGVVLASVGAVGRPRSALKEHVAAVVLERRLVQDGGARGVGAGAVGAAMLTFTVPRSASSRPGAGTRGPRWRRPAAGCMLLRLADIGEPGEHWLSLLDSTSGEPVVKLDQPSLGAADPSGFTHETCIQVPAWAPGASGETGRCDGYGDQRSPAGSSASAAWRRAAGRCGSAVRSARRGGGAR